MGNWTTLRLSEEREVNTLALTGEKGKTRAIAKYKYKTANLKGGYQEVHKRKLHEPYMY